MHYVNNIDTMIPIALQGRENITKVDISQTCMTNQNCNIIDKVVLKGEDPRLF